MKGDITTLSYIQVHEVGKSDSGKTLRFEVRHESGAVLGWIYWFPRWRKYIYHPKPTTVYEETCLNEIAEFIKTKTAEHNT
jgi:hypothetical protein